jgi:hypothetical protein
MMDMAGLIEGIFIWWKIFLMLDFQKTKYRPTTDLLRILKFYQFYRYEMDIKGERVFQGAEVLGGKSVQLGQNGRY